MSSWLVIFEDTSMMPIPCLMLLKESYKVEDIQDKSYQKKTPKNPNPRQFREPAHSWNRLDLVHYCLCWFSRNCPLTRLEPQTWGFWGCHPIKILQHSHSGEEWGLNSQKSFRGASPQQSMELYLLMTCLHLLRELGALSSSVAKPQKLSLL